MCFFSTPNLDIKSKAYQKGVHSFKCGCCPECLREKASYWALRCSMQAKSTPGVMVTLTYDSYIYDKAGRVIGERVAKDMCVDKKDCQLFIKRLRKFFDKLDGRKIKYLLTAEYGKKTHRPHYHALLFNVTFSDIVFYKLSKRGNAIYKSKTLDKLWNNGICTVDSININGKTARYCTKYCAKDAGAEDTFMLFSHGIGDDNLMAEFNGKSYMIEGREYIVPKLIWHNYISKCCNNIDGFPVLYRYFNKPNIEKCINMLDYQFQMAQYDYFSFLRERFIEIKENNELYRQYLLYWHNKIESIYGVDEYGSLLKKSDLQRLRELPDEKYYIYKQKAIDCKLARMGDRDLPLPRANLQTAFNRYMFKRYNLFAIEDNLPFPSCHGRANDTDFDFNFEISSLFKPSVYEFNLVGVPDSKKAGVLKEFMADCPF